MDRRKHALAALVAAAAVGLTGCGSVAIPGAAQPPKSPVSGVALVGRVEALHPGTLSAGQVAAADTAFGWDLYGRICRQHPSSNLALSPASAAEALGMLDAGAHGATAKAVSQLLHLPPWSPAVVAAVHEQTAALGRVSQVVVANHVFEQKGVRPTARTLDDLVTAYSSDLRQVDFTHGPQATDEINAIIDHDTHGLIPRLFDQPLDASTQTVLANAILLDAKWRYPFPSSAPAPFHTAAGSTVTAPLMNNAEGSYASRTADGWQSVVLAYTAGKLQAVAMLPPPTATACATPSGSTMAALTTGGSTNVGVVLPKLSLTNTLPLSEVLASMGLPLTGDYSGLGAGDSQISQVIQKVVMKVDKSGTKAAAATGVTLGMSLRVPNEVVNFDRPFLMVIEDTATHTPLFVAKVGDPTQS